MPTTEAFMTVSSRAGMEEEGGRRKTAAFSLLFLLCAFRVACESVVPALFVFGDSLVDNGNNNDLSSMAKSNFYPYGVDFSQGPTGRFSNGKTIVDLFCEAFGLPYLPPYTSTFLNDTFLLAGVNYASAAAGILEETGQLLGERFTLSDQVLNFQSNLDQFRVSLGRNTALSHFLSCSIAVVVIGSNDYINNYLLPSFYTSSHSFSPEDFSSLLLDHYSRQLLALHDMGLRKFFITGLAPLGCIPSQRTMNLTPSGKCADAVNNIVGYFNGGLRELVEKLNGDLPDAVFVYANTDGAVKEILDKPSSYGFEVVERACCGMGRNSAEITCVPMEAPCSSRTGHVFWDAFHPSEAVNAILADRALVGPPEYCFPFNLSTLATR